MTCSTTNKSFMWADFPPTKEGFFIQSEEIFLRNNLSFIWKQVWHFCSGYYQVRKSQAEDLFQEAALAFLVFFRNVDSSKYENEGKMFYMCSKYMLKKMYNYTLKNRGLGEHEVSFRDRTKKINVIGYEDLGKSEKDMVNNRSCLIDANVEIFDFMKTLFPTERKVIKMKMMGYTDQYIEKKAKKYEGWVRKSIIPKVAQKYNQYFGENCSTQAS